MNYGRVSSACLTRHVTLDTNPVTSNKQDKNRKVLMISGAHLWSFAEHTRGHLWSTPVVICGAHPWCDT
jgi:hypothetical protein